MKLRDGIDKKIGNFEYLDKDTLITPFITKSYCDYLISEFEKIGWKKGTQGDYNTYLSEISEGKETCKDYLKVIKEKIEPEIIKNWTPAIRNRLWKYYPVPFGKKFSQSHLVTETALHVDNSLLTLFIKLNDGYEGCETVFPRQNWDTSKLKVGGMIVFPGVISHPHYTKKLISGNKFLIIGRITILDVRENNLYGDSIENL